MISRFKLLGVALALGLAFLVGTAWSGDEDEARDEAGANAANAADSDAAAAEAGAAATANMEEMMARWIAAATPGEMHEYLARQVGKWTTRTRIWMEGPQSEPSESTGTSVRRMILDGRFLVDETDGTMLGQTHQGFGLTGYDNFKQRFVATWADNMGTALLTMSGTLDESGKVLTYYGQMDEPMTGEHDKMVRYVHREIDDDQHVFEIYDLAQGEDAKVVEVTYTRAKEE